MLVGYSKGVCDVLEAVVRHSGVRRRVAAVVSVAGAVGGSALVEGIPRRSASWSAGPTCRAATPATAAGSTACGARPGGAGSRATRCPVRSATSRSWPCPSRIACRRSFGPSHRRIAGVDAHNDGQVVWADAFIPAGTFLGYANADHWAVALPIVRGAPPGLRAAVAAVLDRNAFPREVLLEAVVRHVEEELAGPAPSPRPRAALGWLRGQVARAGGLPAMSRRGTG